MAAVTVARWTDIAQWVGPAADNFGDGDYNPGEGTDRMYEVRGVVLHIAEGSYAGTIAWQRNPGSDVSSHFVVAKDGRLAQAVDTSDRAWTQAAGNGYWLSVENEGFHTEAPTAGQIEANAQILARAHREYGVPLQVTDDPNGRGLGWHGMGGAAWGGHYGCPGEQFKAARAAIIARATEIVGGEDMAFLDDPDAKALAYRVDALTSGSGTSRGGPAAGEPIWLVEQVQQLRNAVDELLAKPAELSDVQLAELAAEVVEQLAGNVAPSAQEIATAVLDGLGHRLEA